MKPAYGGRLVHPPVFWNHFYPTKPFSVEELLARVCAVILRTQVSTEMRRLSATTALEDLTIDYVQHLVTLGGRELALTPTEYSLFAYLAQNAGRIVTQDLLLEQVWGSEYLGESHMLQVNINRLRRKIEDDPTNPRYLLSKVGVGYLLAAHPS
jgi:DNA-binding response OmpR family regulator